MALKTLHINQSIQWLSKRIKSSFTISSEVEKWIHTTFVV